MPELPEVETVKEALKAKLINKKIKLFKIKEKREVKWSIYIY